MRGTFQSFYLFYFIVLLDGNLEMTINASIVLPCTSPCVRHCNSAECYLECRGTSCNQHCNSNSNECTIECHGGSCEQNCYSGRCKLECHRGTCVQYCHRNCSLNCYGGNCEQSCVTLNDEKGSGCQLQCQHENNCKQDCGNRGSQCTKNAITLTEAPTTGE